MSDQPDMPRPGAEAALLLASARPGGWSGRVAVLSDAVPREQVDAPICNTSPPGDQQLFDDPADALKKYWLPRYRLAEELVSGQPRYQLGFVERDGSWRLTLRLVGSAPPELDQIVAKKYPMLDHVPEIELSYAVLGAPRSRKAIVFQEVTRTADVVDAALLLSGLAQRDEVFQVLRDPSRGALLTVRRKARIAVAAPAQSGSSNYSLPVAGDPSRQSEWRWCNKCQGLFYDPFVFASRCPAGDKHAAPAQSGSSNYILSSLPQDVAGDPSHQSEWCFCQKCQGLFYGPFVGSSRCPAGDAHTVPAYGGRYSLPRDVAGDPSRQSEWRWCNKCQGLFYGPFVGSSRCPAGGAHAAPAQMNVLGPLRPGHQFQVVEPVRPARPIRPEDRLNVIAPFRPIRPIEPIEPIRPIDPTRFFAVPQLTFLRSERYTVRGLNFVRYHLSVTNWESYPGQFFEPLPNLPCGANPNGSRTSVDIIDGGTGARIYKICALRDPSDLTRLWFAREEGTPPPADVRVHLIDHLRGIAHASNDVSVTAAEPAGPRFRIIEAAIDQIADPAPFAFSPDLHGYVFAGIGGGGGTAPQGGLIRHRESFGATVHSYFQEAAEPERIYHLPDDFRIARRSGGFRPPFMTLRVRTIGDTADDAEAKLDFVMVPATDPARLAAARAALAARTRIAPAELVLQPYVTPDVRFFIQRPTEAGRFDEELPAGALTLQGPIFDTLVMSLADLGRTFDAMLGRTVSLFGGRIEIQVDGWDTEILPFVADFSALAGPLLDITATEPEGGVAITLRNAVESPVLLGTLVLRAQRGGASAEISASGPGGGEVTLAPGESAEFRALAPALPGGGPLDLSVLRGARVVPDQAAILEKILDRATLDYFRNITVKTVLSVFDPLPERPNDQIVAILVEFEGGATVELTSSVLTAVARVDYPFDAVTLRRKSDSRYRYSKTVVRRVGQQRDAEPTEGQAQILFLNVIR